MAEVNILVLDKLYARRDPSQMDMYGAIGDNHTIMTLSEGAVTINESTLAMTDVLYLGIYHQVLPISYWDLFSKIKCPVIIDQADNEDFIRRIPKTPYERIKTPKVFLSRYLPHIGLQAVIPEVKQLSWYVSPERANYHGEDKTIDVTFMCSMYRQRSTYAETIRAICVRNGWSCYVGQTWGDEYLNVLRKTRLFVVECSRKCYTQKYTEAILCGCTIVGDRPLYPISDIRMIDAVFPDVESAIREGLNKPLIAGPEFASKAKFLAEFENILNSLK